MNDPTLRIDPTNLDAINAQTRAWAEGGETIRPIAIGRIVIEDAGIDALADVVVELGGDGPVMLVTDHTLMRRRGDDLKALIEARLHRAIPTTIRRLPDPPSEPRTKVRGSSGPPACDFHADLDAARELAPEIEPCTAVVSVGSGSITDVAKYARSLAADKTARTIPFITFPTAASVTAYTSAIAVLTKDGVKRNFIARLPEAIVCDLPALAEAPLPMTRAGYADVLARSVAYGDWYLAGQLGMDDLFSRVPDRLLKPAEQAMIDAAEAMVAAHGSAFQTENHGQDARATEMAGIRAVIEALLLAGMAMSMINHTAPISGWEHVISHFLDMTAARDGREMALHGGQVGVGTLIAARAYDRAWADLDLDRLTADVSDADIAARRRTIEEVFGPCDPTGRMVGELRREFDGKLTRWQTARATRQSFADRKRAGELDHELRSLIRTGPEVANALARAGAPQRFADLDRPITAGPAHAAVRHSHLVRGRFTLGDLLDHTGWLNEAAAAELLDERA